MNFFLSSEINTGAGTVLLFDDITLG